MPWNETTRKHSRKTGRYESDLTDAEWALLEPLLSSSCRLGRPRQVDLREVANAIAYMLWTGCSWRALPKDCPAFTTNRLCTWLRLDQHVDRKPSKWTGRSQLLAANSRNRSYVHKRFARLL